MFDKSWLTIDISSFCNYRCGFCSQRNSFIKNKKFLEFSVIKKIIDSFVENKIKISNLNPYFRGEPLLHPNFPDILEYILKKAKEFLFVDFIVIHTNAYFLNGKNADVLLEISSQKILPHPNNLFLSLDASDDKTYSKIRRGGNFNIVKNNVIEFLKKREKLRQFGPNIIFQCIINEENCLKTPDFYYFWSDILKKYSSKSFEVKYTENNENFEVKTDTIYFRVMESEGFNFDKNKSLFYKGLNELKKRGIIK